MHDEGEVRLLIEPVEAGALAHLEIDHRRRRNAIGPAVIASLVLVLVDSAVRPPDFKWERDPRRSPSATASASPVVSAVAGLCQWLRWPLIVLGVLVGAWLAWRFAPVLRRGLRQLWASVSTFWSGWFEGWRAWWRRRRRATRSARRRDDPLADWRDLESAPPRDAVLGAYGRMLDALEVLDHPRSPEHTPLDLLARWPAPWRDGRAAARRLTDVYLQAAYAPDAVPEAARREALTALADLRTARDQRAAIEARSR